MVEARRLDDSPILTPASHDAIGENLNGPSLVRAPGWVDDPPGTYYLYFADHGGSSIRLAYADDLTGPWRLHPPGALALPAAGDGFDDHIASPDVHVDPGHERVRMYYHGCCAPYEDATGTASQFTRLAVADDGVDFRARPEPLGRFYFRVFEYDGAFYALAKENRGADQARSGQRVYRSPDGLSGFEPGPLLFEDGARHTAVRRRGESLDVFYSRIGDAPERILHATIDLSEPWHGWTATAPETVLEPDRGWEGAGRPVEPSTAGAVHEPVCQLRDPAVYRGPDRDYLAYAVAGERGLAIAELEW